MSFERGLKVRTPGESGSARHSTLQEGGSGMAIADNVTRDQTDAPGRTDSKGLPGHLGKHLRAVYAALVSEPVPDKFLQLLKQLEEKEAGENQK